MSLKAGDPCPLCDKPLVIHRREKDLLVCPSDWSKWTPQGDRVKAKKTVRYGGSLDWRDRL